MKQVRLFATRHRRWLLDISLAGQLNHPAAIPTEFAVSMAQPDGPRFAKWLVDWKEVE